jgi:murein DD-endopeptidase MepM/ murein hydrolase activator NlpD
VIDRRSARRRVRVVWATALIGILGVLIIGGVFAANGGLAGLGAPAISAGAATPSAGEATSPTPSAGGETSAAASAPPASPAASASPSGVAPSSPASPEPVAAPVSAAGFRVRQTVVPMGFPLPAGSNYRYGDRWRVPRVGRVYPYEEVRGRAADGTLLRAHDGVDLLVKIGTPVLAAFDGIVVDPATIWRPWDPGRYGTVVVIRSTESSSPGYMAIAAHLSRRAVQLGDAVYRGQVIGWTGRTGNAAATLPHLHFELRAPFRIAQVWGGIRRLLDVFDPLPSLLVAETRR